MGIIGGIKNGAIATWRFISPVYWDGFHRIRVPADKATTESATETTALDAPVTTTAEELEITTLAPVLAKPRWRAPLTQPTHNSVPALSLMAAWTVCKDLALPEGNEDASVWVSERQLAAVFDGATESFAARRWVNILSTAWEQDHHTDTGRMTALQQQYAADVNAMDLSWAQEQAAGRGSFTTVASIQAAPGGLAATCVGDSAIALVKNGCIVEAYPSMQPVDYSSVPDALGSSQELLSLGQELLETCSWTIPVEPGEFDMVVLATDAVAVWLLEENHLQPNGHLAAVLEIGDATAWEQLVAKEREAGRMKTDDSTVMIIAVEGAV